MKICKLIRDHSFKDVRVFEKEAVSLSKMGHDVTIVTGMISGFVFGPNRGLIKDKIFQKDHFIYKGIQFLTYNTKPINRNNAMTRMVQELRANKQEYFIDDLYKKALSVNADVYHAHELMTLYEAVQIKRSLRKKGKNVKVIYDAHELEADSKLLKLMMKEVDHLITVSESIKEIYMKRYPGIPVTLIYNSPLFQEEIPENQFNEEPFTITYEGVVTVNKGDPQKILDIVNLCKSQIGEMRFLILGKLPNSPLYRPMQLKMDKDPNIECKWVDYFDLPKYLSKTHVGYIYFNLESPNRFYALPNKFFSYLNSGVPVVVNESIEMKNFIEKYKCGIVIEKKEPTAADYVEQFQRLYQDRKLLKQMSENGREAMRSTYCWERMEERLKEVYDHLI